MKEKKEEDLRLRIAKVLGELPHPAKVEKYKVLGPLTAEEEHYIMSIVRKVGEINALTFIHPLINHKRVDPYLRKKVAELEEIIPKIRH